MPRVLEELEGLPVYRVSCDQCGLYGPHQSSMEEATFGFEQPQQTVGIFLCSTCARMDLGREDWLLRYSPENLSQRTNMRGEIQQLREDPHVEAVNLTQPSAEFQPRHHFVGDHLVIVQFVQGARQPQNADLARQVAVRRTRYFDDQEPSPLVQQLIQTYREQTGIETDFSLGTPPRLIMEATAQVVQQVESQSLGQYRDVILSHLTTQLGPDWDLSPGTDMREMADQITEQAYEAHMPDVRENILRRYLDESATVQRAAPVFGVPLRQRVDYQSVARRTFLVDQLPPGAAPFLFGDPPNEPITAAPLPDWCLVGGFVRRLSDGVTARIIEVGMNKVLLQANSEPPPWDGVLTWDRYLHAKRVADAPPPRITDPIPFEEDWEPASDPSPPRTAWQRIIEGVL